MSDTALIIASDPNAPKAIELGEDGDYIVENTLDPTVAERIIREYAEQNNDMDTQAEVLPRLTHATYRPGTWWWREHSMADGAELVDIAKDLPPAPFRGVLVTMDWTE